MNRINKSSLAFVLGSLIVVSHTANAMVSIKHLIGKKSEAKSSKPLFKQIQSFEGLENEGSTFGKLLQPQLKESVEVNENPNQIDEFIEAIFNNNLEKIKKILNTGINVNQYNDRGSTPLGSAVFKGNIDIVELLLKYGAHLNEGINIAKIPQSNRHDPFHVAIAKGNKDMVEFLLKHGADVNIVEECHGITPLHSATADGDEDMVKLLLKYGADVNSSEKANGWTALYIASQNGYEHIAELLLNSGALVDKSNNKGSSPLDIACFKGDLKMVKLLVKYKADVNKKSNDTSTPLYNVCLEESEDRVQIVNLLLNAGAKHDYTDYSPLYLTILHGHLKMATALIKGKANINLNYFGSGITPLILACMKNRYAMMKRLVNLGADVSLCNNVKTSPLHIAAAMGNRKIIEFLVNNKANLWATNDEGKTARMLVHNIARSEISKKKHDYYKKIEEFLEKQENLQTPLSLNNSKNLNTNFVKEKKLKIDSLNDSIEDENTDSVLNDHMNEYLENAKIWSMYSQGKSLDLTNPSSSTNAYETKNYFIISNSSSLAPWTLVLKKNNHSLKPIKNATILSQKPDLYHTISRIIFNTPKLFSQGRMVEYCKDKTTAKVKSLIKKYSLYEDALPSTCDIVWFPGSLFTGKSASQHLENLKKCFNETNNSWNESRIKSYLNTIKNNALNKTLTKQRARFGAALGIVVDNAKKTNTIIPHLFFHKKQ